MYHKKKNKKKKLKIQPTDWKMKEKEVDWFALWDTVFNNVLCCILVTVSNVAGDPGILFIQKNALYTVKIVLVIC